MIVWGGNDGGPTNTGGRYNPLNDSWASTSTTGAPSGRDSHFSIVWSGSRMIVWGGYDDVVGDVVNSGAIYNPLTNTWTSISNTNAPDARKGHAAVWTGSKLIIWGGQDHFSNYFDSGAMYDLAGGTWTSTSVTNAPGARVPSGAVWTGSKMVVLGGGTNTGGVYTPPLTTSDSRSAITSSGAPSNRRNHSAVWTGGEVIIWGGETSGDLYSGNVQRTPTNTGFRYNPATNTWVQISNTNAPTARWSHSAVWTGKVMIIFGGFSNDSTLPNEGGIYDPAADTWAQLQTASGPVGRYAHSAIWTGSKMLIWGGSADGDFSYDDGAMYDIDSNSWTSISTTNAPSERAFHSSIWTGSNMIVFGGNDLGYVGNALNTGHKFDPITNTWSSISTVGAVSRDKHSAIWTGSRMIVWGGSAGNSGESYNPENNSWTSISQTNAPSGRAFHSAVWTGSRMLIVNGSDATVHYGSNGLSTGAAYDPATNAWSAITTSGASSRFHHTGVWTGSSLMTFGGISYGGNNPDPAVLSSGGDLYLPAAHP